MQEPDGYPGPNDAVIAACAASGGRLVPLARLDPNADDPLGEAQRALDAGVAGFKLHPRSDAFGLPHPEVTRIVQLAGEHGKIVLFHAGRGIPRLGEAAIELARANPAANIILAHAGISDLGWLEGPASELGNIYFDTSWWQVWDLLDLFARIPPARILYASDMPYGAGILSGAVFLRCAQEAGHGPEALASMAGGQIARLVAGEEALELGPAPGPPAPAADDLPLRRAIAYISASMHLAINGARPLEALSLARLACQCPAPGSVLGVVDDLLARTEQAVAEMLAEQEANPSSEPPMRNRARRAAMLPIVAAQLIAGTPHVALPSNWL
jgi:hypothetical protein